MLRLLVIGTKFGSTYLNAARNNPHWEIAGIVARTEKSRKEAGKKFDVNEKNQFKDIDSALDNCKDVDAVVVAVPNNLHHEFAKKVIEKDLHLILEKPIVETWEQAIDLVKSLNLHPSKKACVGQTLRGDVMIRLMEHFLREGIIGKIEQVTFESHWWWTGNPDAEWRFQLPHMFLDDIGIHQIDEIRMLVGNKKCKELVANAYTPPSYPLKHLKATATASWEMEDDIHVSYFGSMGSRGKDVGWYGMVNIFGDKGSMFRDSSGQPFVYLEGEKKPVGLDDEYGDDIDEYLPLIEHEKIDYILEDFYQAITHGTSPVTDLRDNIYSFQILLAMKKSASEKRFIKVQEEFSTASII
ncbi:MAG: Gfo/Idh/MocA family protein [Promethearchaeota archaeon]